MPAKARTRKWLSSNVIHHTNNMAGPATIVVKQNFYSSAFDDYRSAGTTLSDWKRRIKQKLPATTALTGERVFVYRQPAKYNITREFRQASGVWLPGKSYFSGYDSNLFLFSMPNAPSAVITKASTLANRKFYKKVAETRKAFDGLIWLGELRETLRMLRNPAKALFDSARYDYLQKLKKRKSIDPENWARGLRGAWLEASYGWLPFLSDTRNAYDVFERSQERPQEYRMIVGIGVDTPSCTTTTSTGADLVGGLSNLVTTIESQHAKVKFKGLYFRDSVTSGQLPKGAYIRELCGFEPQLFVPTLWELLPWSFLVDYFSNVGNVLEQSFTSFDNVRWINKTTRLTSRVQKTQSCNESRMKSLANANVWSRWKELQLQSDGFVDTRRILFSRSTESPYPESLTFELPGRPQQWLNMLALWDQANDIHPQRIRDGRNATRKIRRMF